MEKNNTTKVITGECRMSYEHVWEPVSIDGNSPKKYSACILIRKDDTATLKKIKLAQEAARRRPWWRPCSPSRPHSQSASWH